MQQTKSVFNVSCQAKILIVIREYKFNIVICYALNPSFKGSDPQATACCPGGLYITGPNNTL